MRLGYELNLKQTQKLIVTPELRQAIAILQMSAIDLAEFVDQQLLENPCLEMADEEIKPVEVVEDRADQGTDDQQWDMDWQEYFADKSDSGYTQQERSGLRDDPGFEHFLNREPDLQEYLLSQLSLVALQPKEKHIGQFLIGNIDDHGYLRMDLSEVAQHYDVDLEFVEQVLKVIQGFDPTGVGARALTECLLLQLEALEFRDPLLMVLISEHLTELGQGKLPKVAKQLKVSLKRLQDALDCLRQLDPKPGRKFSGSNDVRYIVPDIVVERVGEEYIVLVNDTSVPRLMVNQNYRQVLSGAVGDVDTKKYVETKVNSAAWLIKNIEQRRLTLYKVANCIVNQQRAFFDHGVKYLKPLTLKQVAEVVELHESTISRATANKYMQTPQGVYEMKFFFASGVDNGGGEVVAAQGVKRLLRELVERENPQKPLSDQKLAELLVERGINIARRTITKYREGLQIPAANKRKRY